MEPAPKKFYRTTTTDCKIAGVCGGVAKYTNLDPTLVRILWIIVTIVSLGVGLVGYVVFWIAAPREDEVTGRGGAPPLPTRTN